MVKDFYEDERGNCYQAIRNTILPSPAGAVFAMSDFEGFGSREAVRSALAKLVRECVCDRALPSVFYHKGLDAHGRMVLPDVCEVAYARARQCGWQIAPGPELAASMFGLVERASDAFVFVINGHARWRYELQFGTIVFQFTEKQWLYKKIAQQLPECQIDLLAKEMSFAPTWMQEHLNVVILVGRAEYKRENSSKDKFVDFESELERALRESRRLNLRDKTPGRERQVEEIGL